MINNVLHEWHDTDRPKFYIYDNLILQNEILNNYAQYLLRQIKSCFYY